MTQDKKDINFTKAAHSAFNSLTDKEKSKAVHFLDLIARNEPTELQNKIYKLAGTEQDIYALKLNLKLRIIIEIAETQIVVLDILNHDLFVKYFKNRS